MERLVDIRTKKEIPLYDCSDNYALLDGQPNAIGQIGNYEFKVWLAADYKNPEDGFKILEEDIDAVSDEKDSVH